MYKPNRNQIYDAVILRMITEGLQAKEAQFAVIYEKASNEELLEYLRQQAQELGHSPWPKEIVGWMLIRDRFGDWRDALYAAGLPMPTTPNSPTRFKLYQDEMEIQKRIYRANKAEKKAKAQERNKARAAKRQQRELSAETKK